MLDRLFATSVACSERVADAYTTYFAGTHKSALATVHSGVTLTTYLDIPWNTPFYGRLGYTQVDEPSAGLAAIRAYEVSVGLDEVGPRIAMRP